MAQHTITTMVDIRGAPQEYRDAGSITIVLVFYGGCDY